MSAKVKNTKIYSFRLKKFISEPMEYHRAKRMLEALPESKLIWGVPVNGEYIFEEPKSEAGNAIQK